MYGSLGKKKSPTGLSELGGQDPRSGRAEEDPRLFAWSKDAEVPGPSTYSGTSDHIRKLCPF